jgi:hypothetical protein
MYKVYSGEIVAAKVSSGAGFDKFEQIQMRTRSGAIETVRDLIVPTDISLHIASGNQIALGVLRYFKVNFCVSARAREDFFPPTENLLRPMANTLPRMNAGLMTMAVITVICTLGMALIVYVPAWLWLNGVQKNFRKRATEYDWRSELARA